MKIQKRYKDEETWFDIKEDSAHTFLSQDFVEPQAVIDDLKAEAKENAPGPSQIVATTWAFYRAVD